MNNPDVIKGSIKSCQDSLEFATGYAKQLAGGDVELISKAVLPSVYGRHLKECGEYQLQYFRNHVININVQLEPSNQVVEAPVYKFISKDDGLNILVGVDYRRIDYYNAAKAANPFSLMFGAKLNSKCDYMQWGCERFYACVYTSDREDDAMEAYLSFVSTFKYSPDLERKASELAEKRFQEMYLKSAQLAGQAQAFAAQSAAFRSQAVMSISRDLNSISDGIMDSWNQKMASDSRISNNFSEAIRGVNTYTDVNGKSFEFSNQADHVYTNQYGDHIGVSGQGVDETTKTRLNWTEVFKK